MKRNKEALIVVNFLIENKLLDENKIDVAKNVVKEAFKEIRREKFLEKRR